MVDVAAIFDEVFGLDDQSKGLSKNRCAKCVGVSGGLKSLNGLDKSDTPDTDKRHTLKQGVLEAGEKCARDSVENQEVTGKDTPTHLAHRKSDNPLRAADIDAFRERAALVEFDGGLPRDRGEDIAAQDQGFGSVIDFMTALRRAKA